MRWLHALCALTVVAAGTACGDNADEPVAAGSGTDGTTPSCEQIEAFADVLTGTGIDYDYTASNSPADLVQSAGAVFSGRLTGNVTSKAHTVADDPYTWTFTGFEIHVDRTAKAAFDMESGDTATIYVEYSPATQVTEERLAEAVTPGTPVVVFAGLHEPLGEHTAFMTEGFMTACPDGPLLGRFGTQGTWATIDSLDAVIDAASPTPSTTTITEPAPAQPDTTSIPTTSTGPEVPGPRPPGVPDHEPNVTGTVGTDDEGRPGILVDPNDTYFARMALNRGDPIVFDLDTGEQLDFGDLAGGDRIAVWIDGGCAESFPVQCTVAAIGVNRGR